MSNGRSYGDIKFAAIQEENEELRRRLKEVVAFKDVQTREIQKNTDAMRSAEMCIKTLRGRLAKLEPVYTAVVRQAVEAEREACASLCDDEAEGWRFRDDPQRMDACRWLADMIRARTAQPKAVVPHADDDFDDDPETPPIGSEDA